MAQSILNGKIIMSLSSQYTHISIFFTYLVACMMKANLAKLSRREETGICHQQNLYNTHKQPVINFLVHLYLTLLPHWAKHWYYKKITEKHLSRKIQDTQKKIELEYSGRFHSCLYSSFYRGYGIGLKNNYLLIT